MEQKNENITEMETLGGKTDGMTKSKTHNQKHGREA